MSGRRGRGGGAAPGGRGRLVVMGGGRGGAGRGGGGGGPPKTLNERFQALATAPQAKRKAQANQTQANSRFAKVRTSATPSALPKQQPHPARDARRHGGSAHLAHAADCALNRLQRP
jgi:hypothetical protein